MVIQRYRGLGADQAIGTSKSDVQPPAKGGISWVWVVGGAAALYWLMG